MKRLLLLAILCAGPALAALPAPGTPGAIDDPRYCGEPVRDKHGVIKRSQAVLNRFVKVFPCPATLVSSTTCAGWALNHMLPLADGGCDAPINLWWLPDSIKSCSSPECIDRWERKYSATPRQKIVLQAKP